MSLREAIERDKSSLRFSSGCNALDEILGGGFKTGEMVEVFGASGTAKTQLALQSALMVASAGFTCAYVDTEGQFRPERLSSICEGRGKDPAKILPLVYSVRAEDTSKQVATIAMIHQNEDLRDCRMLVVDTVTKNFTLEFAGAKMIPSRQTALGAYLNRLARDAYTHDRAVLLLNRVASVGRDEPSREVDIGGETIRHFVQKALHLQRRQEEVSARLEDEPNSREVRLRITALGLVTETQRFPEI